MLMYSSAGIADPCEKDVVDACGNLTMQEREDITWASQVKKNSHFLVFQPISFRFLSKIDKQSMEMCNSIFSGQTLLD